MCVLCRLMKVVPWWMSTTGGAWGWRGGKKENQKRQREEVPYCRAALLGAFGLGKEDGVRKRNRRSRVMRCHGQAAPTHLPPPKALAEGVNTFTLQLLEERTHLGPMRSRLSTVSAPPPPFLPPPPVLPPYRANTVARWQCAGEDVAEH